MRAKSYANALKYARLLPVLVPSSSNRAVKPPSQAGFEPEALDKTVEKHILAVAGTISVVESLGKQVQAALENMQSSLGKGNSLQEAERVVTIFERTSRSCMNLVKCTDELTRLRSFIAGGPDSRPDLSSKSQSDLVKEVLAAIKELGWTVTIPSSGKLRSLEVT